MVQRDPFLDFFDEGGGFGFGNFLTPTSFTKTATSNEGFGLGFNPQDIFQEFGEETQQPFFGALGRADLTPNDREFFKGQRANINNQFQGILDQRIRAGLEPIGFTEFLNQPNFFEERARERPGAGVRAAPITRVIRR